MPEKLDNYQELELIEVYGGPHNSDLENLVNEIEGLKYVSEYIESSYGSPHQTGIALKPNELLNLENITRIEEIEEVLNQFLGSEREELTGSIIDKLE